MKTQKISLLKVTPPSDELISQTVRLENDSDLLIYYSAGKRRPLWWEIIKELNIPMKFVKQVYYPKNPYETTNTISNFTLDANQGLAMVVSFEIGYPKTGLEFKKSAKIGGSTVRVLTLKRWQTINFLTESQKVDILVYEVDKEMEQYTETQLLWKEHREKLRKREEKKKKYSRLI